MPLTGISNRGLLLIASLVAILWAVIFAERAIIRQARHQTELLLRSRPTVPVREQQKKQRRPSAPVASFLPLFHVGVQADFKV